MEAAASGAQPLPPAEADWSAQLRLPAPTHPPPGMDDSQFLGSIMGDTPRQGPADPLPEQQLASPATVPKKRGRPPKKSDGAAVVAPAKPAKRREDEEEVVCFICFDGGNLVVCDRRGCPKVYHPACIKRDESFFNSRTKWNCGWHICSSCEKAVHYMCYTCTYSLCKVCIKQGKFFSVRGKKGFCDTCFGTILLIESKDEAATKVDFDDINSWEYLFKLYWLDLKGKLSLTLEELTSAKSRWTIPNTCTRKEKEESSDDLYDIDNDDDAGSDCSSRKRRRNSSKKKGHKRQKVNSNGSIVANKAEPAIRDAVSPATKVPTERVSLPADTKWASPELLEFVGHMRGGDQSFISRFDVQTDLLEYIKKNNLRDPKRKSQIICDARLHRLFKKTRVAHFEMLKLLEMHFLVDQCSEVNDNSQVAIDISSAQVDTNGCSDMGAKSSPDKRRRIHRKMESETQVNPEAYAAVDMHNINLIYVKRSLMEDLIDDASFLGKIYGAFVRIKISGAGQKQDIYRLVKVVGTHKVPEKYIIGKKTTNLALEILNLDRKEIITMDTISNQDFTEEECNRLRQSMKCGLISRLKVGVVQEKAKILQSVRVNDRLDNEKQRLEHLRDRASETGRKKELREYVEKLQLLNNSEERTRRINEVLEVHVDPHMDPTYESAEEMDDKRSVGVNANRTRADTSVSRRKSKYPKSTLNHIQTDGDADHHPKILSTENTMQGLRTGGKFENFHHTSGTDVSRPSTRCEAGSVSSSVLTMSSETEPEKVWHYKDPQGIVQGPFTLLQLSKWIRHFPSDLKVWLTFESEDRSLLLTEVLSKQQTVFTQTTSVTTCTKAKSAGIECKKNNSSVDQINALTPTGYGMLNSSVVTVQSNKYAVPERESVNSPEDCLSLSTSSVPVKYVHNLNSQVQCQTKHSVFVQSPGSPCGQTDLHHDGAHGGCSDESNHRYSSVTMKSSIMAQMSCNGKSNVASRQDQHLSWSQNQNDSKNSSQGVFMKEMSKNLPTQRVGKDVSSPLFAWSPSESRTASSQHDGSCLSSTTNPNFLDEHHSSIASTKPKCFGPATPIEDRGSSSPSCVLGHSERAPNCSPQSAPSASVSDMCKIEEMINQQNTLEEDTPNAPIDQSPESKVSPVSSPDNRDVDHEFPRVPNCSPQSAPSASVSDVCKIEEMINQQNTLEEDTPNSPIDQSPESKVSPVSSPDNKDVDHEFPSPTPRPENKEPLVDNSGLKPVSPDSLANTYSPVSDSCKMGEIGNQHTALEAGASNSSGNHNPQSETLHVPLSNDKDVEPESARSDNKEQALDDSLLISAATEKLRVASASDTDTCKMEDSANHKKTLEEDTSNASATCPNIVPVSSTDQGVERAYPTPVPRSGSKELAEHLRSESVLDIDACKMEVTMYQEKTPEFINQSPHSNIVPVSSTGNQDIECADPNPTHLSENKKPTENLEMASDTDTCKMEATMNQQKTLEDASINQSPCSSTSPVSSTDNQGIEHACPSPAPVCGNMEPSLDNLKSAAAENETSTSAGAPAGCKMEMLNKKTILETDASNNSVAPSPRSEDFLVTSDKHDIQHEYPSPTPRPENKEPVVDAAMLMLASSNATTKVPGGSPDPCASPKSGPPTGNLDAMESDDKHVEETIRHELYSESTENVIVDPSYGAESIDVSDVLESLMEERYGTLHGTAAPEDFLAASAEEEPQCSSPIALSPWGEPSYYQGDAIDSALWGVEDDPGNAMWSFLPPTPSLQPSSGLGTKASETLDIDEVAVSHGGPMLGEENVKNSISDAATCLVLPEQVHSKPNNMSASSVYENTGIAGWQPSASQNVSAGTASGTNHNFYLPSCEGAVTSSSSSWEASWKQGSTNCSVSSSGEAIGNTNKSWNAPPVSASTGNLKNHRRVRYSEISESWLLSSNNSRSRSDRFGSGGSSRSTLNGQSRGV